MLLIEDCNMPVGHPCHSGKPKAEDGDTYMWPRVMQRATLTGAAERDQTLGGIGVISGVWSIPLHKESKGGLTGRRAQVADVEGGLSL